MNILITGANGQLGSEIHKLSSSISNAKFFFTDVDQLDICNPSDVQSFISANKIDSIINCAAYTNVDKSESDRENALNVNAKAIKNLLDAVSEVANARVIHISTDYVFDGKSHVPYHEHLKTDPINYYGLSKRTGEEFVESSSVDSIVIRTSWLYSVYGNNFAKTMMRLGETKESLNVIYDQIGTPTNARDFAKATLSILSNKERMDASGKILHYSNEGVASWYDFAKEIMILSNLDCKVYPILTKDYPETPAKRPHYSVMSKEKIKSYFNLSIPHWKDSLEDCINELKNQ